MLLQIYFLIIIIEFAPIITGAIKTWKYNKNFNVSSNWDKGRVPCGKDRAIFSTLTDFSVELPRGVIKLKEIVFPLNGELIMSPNSFLIFTGDKENNNINCPGEDVTFLRSKSKLWLNPNNWNGSNSATPHLERIPCYYDTVIFPDNSAFSVFLPPVAYRIGRIKISGRELGAQDWINFLDSDSGINQFKRYDYIPDSVQILNADCDLPEGCLCGQNQLKQTICDTFTCNYADCAFPILPAGFCCEICGAYILLNYKNGFEMAKVKAAIELFLSTDFEYYVSRVAEEEIQIVLTEKGIYNGKSGSIAKELLKYLLDDTELLLVKKTEVFLSGIGVPQETKGVKFTIFIGCFIMALILIASILLSRYDLNELRIIGTGYSFARFENITGEVELEHEIDVVVQPTTSKSNFNNPMYFKNTNDDLDEAEEFQEIDVDDLNSLGSSKNLLANF